MCAVNSRHVDDDRFLFCFYYPFLIFRSLIIFYFFKPVALGRITRNIKRELTADVFAQFLFMEKLLRLACSNSNYTLSTQELSHAEKLSKTLVH